MSKNKKLLTAAVALTAAAVMGVGGTFAWQSISQSATNEQSDKLNPGGRLHDDFDGTDKNVYVENFGDEAGGKNIFARVRLEEYFEMVLNYGTSGQKVVEVIGSKTEKKDDDGQPVKTDNGNTVYDYTYEIFTDYGTTTSKAGVDENATSWWTWEHGGSTVFMPTYNKNKDSLKADINGEYLFDTGVISSRDNDQYTEMKTWEAGDKETHYAVYDADSNDIDEIAQDDLDDIIENGALTDDQKKAVRAVYETHTAKTTHTATLISMTNWLALTADGYDAETHGDYWVYDDSEDGAGWVYWAAPIAPGEATGLLLDGIKLNQVMDDTWYYAINVVAQFVTAGDMGSEKGGDGFYDADAGAAPSENALELLDRIGATTPEDGGDDSDDDDDWDGALFSLDDQYGHGATYTFKADDVGSTTYLKDIDFENGGAFELFAKDGVTVDVTFGDGSDAAKGRANVESTEYDAEEHMLYLEPMYRDPITITATKSKQSYTFTVVPVPTGIVITKGDTAEDVQYTLTPRDYRDYSIQPVNFDDTNVTYTVEGAKRCKITEHDELSINPYESAASFTVTATDGSGNSGTVTIVLAETTPTDDPVFVLWHSSEGGILTEVGRLVPGGTMYLQAGENYVIEADFTVDDDYSYTLGLGYNKDGESYIVSDTDMGFVNGEPENEYLNYTGMMFNPYEWEGEMQDGILSLTLKTFEPADGREFHLTVTTAGDGGSDGTWGTVTLSFKDKDAAPDPDPDPSESGSPDPEPTASLDPEPDPTESGGGVEAHNLSANLRYGESNIDVVTCAEVAVWLEDLKCDGTELTKDDWSGLTATFYKEGETTDPVDTVYGSDFKESESGNYCVITMDPAKVDAGTNNYDLYLTYTKDDLDASLSVPIPLTITKTPITLTTDGNTASVSDGLLVVDGEESPWDGMLVTDVLKYLKITVNGTEASYRDNGNIVGYEGGASYSYEVDRMTECLLIFNCDQYSGVVKNICIANTSRGNNYVITLTLNGATYSVTMS